MFFHIVKFGGGCLRCAKDVVRLSKVLTLLKGNIVVVSAFYGMTNMLTRVVDEKSSQIFFGKFLQFHKNLAKDLELSGELEQYFQQMEVRFKNSFDLLCDDRDETSVSMSRAEIISMGEAFAQQIVSVYLKKAFTSLKKEVYVVDARGIISTENVEYIDAEIDQNSSKKLIEDYFDTSSRSSIFVVQGFVAGVCGSFPLRTALMKREGSDFTAALIAACLKGSFLTYVKRFPKENVMMRVHCGIKMLFDLQKEQGVVIISSEIANVEGLPTHFRLVDFLNPKVMSSEIVVDPNILESIRKQSLKDKTL